MPDLPPFSRIGPVARLLGEKPYVVRFWEAELGIRPQRSRKGQRVYTRAQVEKLLLAKFLLRTKRLTIEGARQALRDPDREAVRRLREMTSALLEAREALAAERAQDALQAIDRGLGVTATLACGSRQSLTDEG